MRFLLITRSEDDPWRMHLEETLAPLGCLDVVEKDLAIDQVLKRNYVAIVVDAAAVSEFSILVARIRAQIPQARVIVTTASPTWQRAREAFQAGATDYVERSLNASDLFASLEAALAKPVMPWP